MRIFMVARAALFVSTILGSWCVHADPITINNMTNEDLWVATYYDTGSEVDRVGQIYSVIKQSSCSIERPVRRLWVDRMLAYSYHQKSLQSSFDIRSWRKIDRKNIGYTNGSTYYLVKKNGVINAYNSIEWMITNPLYQLFSEASSIIMNPLQNYLKIDQPMVVNNPYKNKVATVRTGNELPVGEKNFLEKKIVKVRKALEGFLGKPLGNYVPKIAFVASGGGYRAMMSTVGWFVGASKIGLLDGVTYAATLSGSTWALATWYASGLPIESFRDCLIDKMDDGLMSVSMHDLSLISDVLEVKVAFGQPFSLVDVYGALLANTLLRDFGDQRHMVYLSEQRNRIADADWMFPIYTAVRADNDVPNDSGWYEFTPFEVGGEWLGRYVPTWAFGRKFVDGLSVDDAPEQSLGFFMGIFGSAFAARLDQIYDVVKNKIKSKILSAALAHVMVNQMGDDRIGEALVHNFVVGMRRPIENEEIIKFADAGGLPGFNLPYPPVSGQRPERMADILIFLDASAGTQGNCELRKAEHYARVHNLKFPLIDYDRIQERVVSVFKDSFDADVPVVIYLPLVNDASMWSELKNPICALYQPFVKNFDVKKCLDNECGTLNFSYTAEESMRLSRLLEFNMVVSKDVIKEAIGWKVAQKTA